MASIIIKAKRINIKNFIWKTKKQNEREGEFKSLTQTANQPYGC